MTEFLLLIHLTELLTNPYLNQTNNDLFFLLAKFHYTLYHKNLDFLHEIFVNLPIEKIYVNRQDLRLGSNKIIKLSKISKIFSSFDEAK